MWAAWCLFRLAIHLVLPNFPNTDIDAKKKKKKKGCTFLHATKTGKFELEDCKMQTSFSRFVFFNQSSHFCFFTLRAQWIF